MVSPETDTVERVEVVDRPEPTASQTDPAEARCLTLAQRLAVIRADAFGIGKDNIKMSYLDKKSGDRKEFTIKGHTVEAVLSEMRPLLGAAGVLLVPNLVERTYTGNRCDVLVDFEWESLDDPGDRRVVRWAGAGTDDGDKGFSKAGTNALKEHLKKLFLITDRDDAKEEEEKVEHRTEEAVSRKELDAAKERAEDGILGWAQAFKAALEGAKDVKSVGRLQAENAARLAAPELPPVTKQFFEELIERRKKELGGK